MQQGLCESFVWEEFTSHGLHSVKREDPSSLDGSSSTKVRAPIHMEEDLQIEVWFRCICLCKAGLVIKTIHNLLGLLNFQISVQFKKNLLEFTTLKNEPVISWGVVKNVGKDYNVFRDAAVFEWCL